MAEPTEILAIDVGDKNSGVARASSVARLAEPLASVPTEELVEFVIAHAKSQPVAAVVFGLPRNLKGEETAQSRSVRDFVEAVKTQIKASLFWQDETLSTKQANSQPLTAKADEHATAAAVILQD